MVRKGDQTKHSILTHAVGLARSLGLEGLTIGRLAEDLHLSKSGLFAHFQSKERLQIQVLESAADKFSREVVRPAMKAPRGPERLWAIFENWMKWGVTGPTSGCIFVAAAAELDDQPGPVRDTLVKLLQEWIGVMERSIELGQEAGTLRADAKPKEVVQHLYGIMMSAHLYHRLFRDPNAVAQARAAAAQLIASITPPSSKTRARTK